MYFQIVIANTKSEQKIVYNSDWGSGAKNEGLSSYDAPAIVMRNVNGKM